MATIEITHTYTPEDPQRVFDRLSDHSYIERELADVLNSATRVAERSMKIYAPHGRTGKLDRAIGRTDVDHGAEGELVAAAGVRPIAGGDPDRGAYPDIGTGRFGPKHRDIRPLAGRFMVFEIDGHKIVTTRVKGQKPQHFVRDAFRDVEEYLPPRLELATRAIVEGRSHV